MRDPAASSVTPSSDTALRCTVPEPILTPCIGICSLDDAGYCEGCRRTGDEIAAWSSMTPAERQWLMDHVLPTREAGPA